MSLQFFKLVRVLEIHKQVYGENDGETGLAICSVAQVLSAKGSSVSNFDIGLR
jgi:hypothetical protein